MIRPLAILPLALALASCGDDPPVGGAPERLSDWGLFAEPASQTPAEGVHRYEVVSPLFSDHAAKHRFIAPPLAEDGTREKIGFTAEGPWDFPEGTILVKTFAFAHDLRDPSAGERLIETRLLVLEEGEWVPYVYLWDESQEEAFYRPAGVRVPVEWIHTDGSARSLDYRVPNVVQCSDCHGGLGDVLPLGPRTEQMDLAGQIEGLAAAGLFASEPPADREALAEPFGEAPLEGRARAYLHANCGHCHRDGGSAGQSGLWLDADVTDPVALGICKRPVAAGAGAGGLRFDIVPGAPDESVMIFRMESDEPGIKMPELPNQLVHAEGVALIRDWIAAMDPVTCGE